MEKEEEEYVQMDTLHPNKKREEEKEEKEEQNMGREMTAEERAVFAQMELAAHVDQEQMMNIYKQSMGGAILFFNTKLAEDDDKWELIPSSDPEEKIALYRQPVSGGFYILKASGTLDARADRVLYLNKDNDWGTRKLWDSEDLTHVQQLNTYRCPEGDINVVESRINTPWPVSERYSVGIQWSAFDEKLGTYKLVFKTAQHFFAKCPEGSVSIDNLSGVWIKPLDPRIVQRKGKKPHKIHQCECIIITYVNPKGWIPTNIINMFHDKLRQRLHTYERVAGREWKRYYGGKNPSRARTVKDEKKREEDWKRENKK